jgi:D-alanyl-D-alanine carboxypeptidase
MKKLLITILSVVIMSTLRPAAASSPKDALQKLADAAVDAGLPGVSIAVYAPDTGMMLVVAGYSDLNAKTPLVTTDLSRIASTSKMYVATVIMQLVEEGKIPVGDKIAKYLNPDDVKHIANADSVTIADVLTHSSGIADYYNDSNFGQDKPEQLDFTIEEALHYAWDMPALFAPGEKYSYSDTNTVLLAVVIEKVTGQNFAQVVRNRIITPLHLTHTYTEIFEPVPVSIVHGYSFSDGGKPDDTIKMQGAGLPDGGIITTTEDMVTFFRALLVDGKLLKPATLADMLKPRFDAEGSRIGYHIFMDGNPPRVYYHDGYIDGYQAWLSHDVQDGVTVAVWANGTGEDQDAAFGNLIDAVQAEMKR